MTTPTTENPKFEFDPNDPPLNFPPYNSTGHKTYLDYQEGNEHETQRHQDGKLEGRGHATHAARDALDRIATTPWFQSAWAKVLMWALIVAATYWLYLRTTGRC